VFGTTRRINPLVLVRLLRDLPFWARLYSRLIQDVRVPLKLKLLPLASLVYLIFPVDLIHDVLFPVVGQLDDLAVLYFCFRTFFRSCPREVVLEHVKRLRPSSTPEEWGI
jgi:uncharacterized membrane protein YkvA (DUF1232 family)